MLLRTVALLLTAYASAVDANDQAAYPYNTPSLTPHNERFCLSEHHSGIASENDANAGTGIGCTPLNREAVHITDSTHHTDAQTQHKVRATTAARCYTMAYHAWCELEANAPLCTWGVNPSLAAVLSPGDQSAHEDPVAWAEIEDGAEARGDHRHVPLDTDTLQVGDTTYDMQLAQWGCSVLDAFSVEGDETTRVGLVVFKRWSESETIASDDQQGIGRYVHRGESPAEAEMASAMHAMVSMIEQKIHEYAADSKEYLDASKQMYNEAVGLADPESNAGAKQVQESSGLLRSMITNMGMECPASGKQPKWCLAVERVRILFEAHDTRIKSKGTVAAMKTAITRVAASLVDSIGSMMWGPDASYWDHSASDAGSTGSAGPAMPAGLISGSLDRAAQAGEEAVDLLMTMVQAVSGEEHATHNDVLEVQDVVDGAAARLAYMLQYVKDSEEAAVDAAVDAAVSAQGAVTGVAESVADRVCGNIHSYIETDKRSRRDAVYYANIAEGSTMHSVRASLVHKMNGFLAEMKEISWGMDLLAGVPDTAPHNADCRADVREMLRVMERKWGDAVHAKVLVVKNLKNLVMHNPGKLGEEAVIALDSWLLMLKDALGGVVGVDTEVSPQTHHYRRLLQDASANAYGDEYGDYSGDLDTSDMDQSSSNSDQPARKPTLWSRFVDSLRWVTRHETEIDESFGEQVPGGEAETHEPPVGQNEDKEDVVNKVEKASTLMQWIRELCADVFGDAEEKMSMEEQGKDACVRLAVVHDASKAVKSSEAPLEQGGDDEAKMMTGLIVNTQQMGEMATLTSDVVAATNGGGVSDDCRQTAVGVSEMLQAKVAALTSKSQDAVKTLTQKAEDATSSEESKRYLALAGIVQSVWVYFTHNADRVASMIEGTHKSLDSVEAHADRPVNSCVPGIDTVGSDCTAAQSSEPMKQIEKAENRNAAITTSKSFSGKMYGFAAMLGTSALKTSNDIVTCSEALVDSYVHMQHVPRCNSYDGYDTCWPSEITTVECFCHSVDKSNEPPGETALACIKPNPTNRWVYPAVSANSDSEPKYIDCGEDAAMARVRVVDELMGKCGSNFRTRMSALTSHDAMDVYSIVTGVWHLYDSFMEGGAALTLVGLTNDLLATGAVVHSSQNLVRLVQSHISWKKMLSRYNIGSPKTELPALEM